MTEVNILVKAKNLAAKALNEVKKALQGVGKSAEGSEKSTMSFADTWSTAMLGINQGIRTRISSRSSEEDQQRIITKKRE